MKRRYQVISSYWNACYIVRRKTSWWPFWKRCKGLRFNSFSSVDDAKKAIPLYDQGSAYWLGTMLDMTKERLGVE